MNKIELFVYNIVKENPSIKFLLRNVYQGIFDLFPRRQEYIKYRYSIRENCFFGFHDVSSINKTNDKCLVNDLTIDFMMPTGLEIINIGYYNLNEKGELLDFVKLDETKTWNYHKGCRLQWLSEDSIIFNTFTDKICSKIININTKKERLLDFPIDAVSKDGVFATSFSYERLNKCMPGYGYPFSDDSYLDEEYTDKTGLFLCDIKNNSKELIISLDELHNKICLTKERENWFYFVTHSEFSYDNNYVSFLFRCTQLNNIENRFSALVVYNIKRRVYTVLPTQGMVSHYIWTKKNEIIAYCDYEGVSGHVLFDISSLTGRYLGLPKINSDGHQTLLNENEIIVDTYPDKWRLAYLYKINIRSNSVEKIASVYSPKKFQTRNLYKHIACDLHPRASEDGSLISFDTCRTGKRGVCIIKLK